MRGRLWMTGLAALMLLATAAPAYGASDNANVGFGQLYYEGDTVRTVVPPAAAPQTGIDDFFVVTNAVEGQLGIAAVAPGDPGYHGGKWAFHFVTWNEGETPQLLTSAADVADYEALGKLTVERAPEMDFKCPIQP